MLVSYNLLKKYVELPQGINPQEMADKLTMATVEVESVKELGSDLKDVVVGKIEEITKHANADRLKLVEVNIGKKENIKIVCGGTNLKKGMLVAVALPGSQVHWHGEGELVKLEKTKIRGEESFGMICASNEIGLSNMFVCGTNEIADLSHLDLELGKPLAEALYLSGVVLDIDNKSLTNRPDLWGHYGVSRELSAIYNVKLRDLDLGEKIDGQNYKLQIINYKLDLNNELASSPLKIEIKDNDLCPRYLGCVIENVKIEESPAWLKQELLATGHSVINNIVDITNYVMEEVGQPLHAFDKALITTDDGGFPLITIRRAEKGEKLVLLDGSELKLDKDMLVIANEDGPIALAGVMGGKNSGINDATTTIVLEAANFDAMNIRKTSQKIGIRTDASMRFEKALDVNLAEIGMRRALQLIQKICPQAKISPIIVEAGEWQNQNIKIEVKHDFIIKRLGKKIAVQEIKDILNRLGFRVLEEEKGVYEIQVPSWRATGDVSIPEDIVEEIARIHGYDNFDENVELIEMAQVKLQPAQELENKIKNYLSLSCGMSEVLNYPWAEEKIMNELGINPAKECLEIVNPPAPELKYLQTSLLPNLIKNIYDNIRYNEQFKIFELARVYENKLEAWHDKAEDILPRQPKKLVGAVVGSKKDEVFLDIKGIVENFKLSIFNFKFIESSKGLDFIDNSRYLEIFLDNEKIGWLGEVNYAKLNFKGKKVALFEIDWEKLVTIVMTGTEVKKYKKLAAFPVIERDLAVEIGWDVKWEELVAAVSKVHKLIKNIKFLSEYPLEEKKSLAFRITYQAERTLKDEEVEKVEQKILSKLGKKFGAELRK